MTSSVGGAEKRTIEHKGKTYLWFSFVGIGSKFLFLSMKCKRSIQNGVKWRTKYSSKTSQHADRNCTWSSTPLGVWHVRKWEVVKKYTWTSTFSHLKIKHLNSKNVHNDEWPVMFISQLGVGSLLRWCFYASLTHLKLTGLHNDDLQPAVLP